MTADPDRAVLQTTATSLDILELLAELDGARASELAERMDRPRSTIHGHLDTLHEKQFAVKEGDIYYPGPELLRLGHAVQTGKEGYVLAEKFTERLFEETGYRTIFVTEMCGRGIFLHAETGEMSEWSHEGPGEQLSLHCTAVGKAILAEKPRRRVEEVVDRWGLPRRTPNTITNRDDLYEELDRVRERGYAVNREENLEGLHAIAVAATDKSGSVIGAFSVSGSGQKFTDEAFIEDIVEDISAIVNDYELELAFR